MVRREDTTHLEELLSGAVDQCTVTDLRLPDKVVGGVDLDVHALDGQEGRQVSRVGGDDDQREEPPGRAHQPPRYGPGK